MKQLIAYTENGKWGYRDKNTNEILIPAQYDEVSPSAEELAEEHWSTKHREVLVKLNGKWGVRSVLDEEYVPTLYDEIKEHIDFELGVSYRLVKINNKWGVPSWGNGNEMLLPAQYDKIEIETLGLQEYNLNGKVGVIDPAGNIIIPPVYDKAHCSGAIKIVGKNEGVDDLVCIPPEHQYIEVLKDNKWGIFDVFGNEKVPVMYDEFPDTFWGNDYNDFFPARLNSKWGYININNEVIIPFMYDNADQFRGKNLTLATMDQKDWLIDRTGKLVYQFEYDESDVEIKNGFARVEYDQTGEVFYIDHTGKIIENFDETLW